MHTLDDKTNYVCECNKAFNVETLHPLVSLIDMSAPSAGSHLRTDCYAVVYKHRAADNEKYGRRYYDFSDGMLLFISPTKEVDLSTADGTLLIFHPNLAKLTPLGMKLREYSFFSYRPDEALHISCCEECVIKRCLGGIKDELCWGIDDYSKTIISNCIELLLNYCSRFYNRQFITRHKANTDAITALDSLIDESFASGQAAEKGLPTASRLAPRLGMSAAYLNDMLRNETGKAVSERVQLRRIQLAKEMLIGSDRSVSEISEKLGFCSEKCFATVFKKITGLMPDEYR